MRVLQRDELLFINAQKMRIITCFACKMARDGLDTSGCGSREIVYLALLQGGAR